jgi:hypothetical protein
MKLELPNNWMIAVNKAMLQLYERFKNDTKFILTESDLKCWLFFELQKQNTDVPYAVHTEVTHYPKSNKIQNGITVEVQKYFFRDLTILNNDNVIENNELWDDVDNSSILSKGFKHRGPAIHFELKLVRQCVRENNIPRIDSNDIQKLNNYSPTSRNHERRFVIVWGSKSDNVSVNELETKLRTSLEDFTNQNLNGKLEFYLFDKKSLKHYSFNNNQLLLNE